MPSKWTMDREVCFPCKWLKNHLYLAARKGSIYHRYCGNPAYETNGGRIRPEYGRFIGQTDIRPEWCPIRGDEAAEAEAERDDD